MMKYAERVEKAKKLIDKNRLFTIIVIGVLISIFGNFLFSKVNPDYHSDETAQTQMETSETESIPIEENPMKWRFYWSDLYVLVGAGGFCTIMIIRERKKERDSLE